MKEFWKWMKRKEYIKEVEEAENEYDFYINQDCIHSDCFPFSALPKLIITTYMIEYLRDTYKATDNKHILIDFTKDQDLYKILKTRIGD